MNTVEKTLIRDHDCSARKVYIYGAGDYGIVTALHLRVQGIEPEAFIDEDANRIEPKTGLTVLKPSDVLCGESGETKPYVVIAEINATTIDKMIAVLEQYGLKNREDFELSIFAQFNYDPHQFIFVIYTLAYDFTIGGVMALFKLHKLLIKHGFNSKICVLGIEKILPPLTGRGTVVIYPEIINGNPLNARNIVRWLLYKPKFHNPNANFTRDELTFCYDKVFNDINLNPDEKVLTTTPTMWEEYRQTNFGKRNGRCYLIKKGVYRTDLPKPLSVESFDGPVIDEMPHSEIANIFNECEYFISYDVATMYLHYAVMCGCIPIIVPDTSADALPITEKIPWIAYGDSPEEISRAKNSRNLMYEYFQSLEEEVDRQVLNFVDICRKRFGIS